MIKLQIAPALLDRTKLNHSEIGSYSLMVFTPEVSKHLEKIYHRKGLALKVFRNAAEMKNPRWGNGASLHTATVIQNLCARENLAPRVYAWVSVNGQLAQVTEYAPKETKPQDHRARLRKLVAFMKKYDLISVAKTLDAGVRNWRDHKFVDFSHLQFKDYDGYLASLDIRARTRRGKLLERAYQPVPKLGILGSRDVLARMANLQLDQIEWKGKTVLDVGCNFGAFSRYATDAGAPRVTGVDKNGELAFEINNVLGYWNLDIIAGALPGKIKLPKSEIVFMMAFHNYVGGLEAALSFVSPVACNLLIVESHGGEDRGACELILKKFFQRIHYLGFIKDPMVRHQWHCFK